jgi:hypothetical protein
LIQSRKPSPIGSSDGMSSGRIACIAPCHRTKTRACGPCASIRSNVAFEPSGAHPGGTIGRCRHGSDSLVVLRSAPSYAKLCPQRPRPARAGSSCPWAMPPSRRPSEQDFTDAPCDHLRLMRISGGGEPTLSCRTADFEGLTESPALLRRDQLIRVRISCKTLDLT